MINHALSESCAGSEVMIVGTFWFLVFHHMAINFYRVVLALCCLLDNILDTVHETDRDYESAAVKFTQYLRQGIGKSCLKGSRCKALDRDY